MWLSNSFRRNLLFFLFLQIFILYFLTTFHLFISIFINKNHASNPYRVYQPCGSNHSFRIPRFIHLHSRLLANLINRPLTLLAHQIRISHMLLHSKATPQTNQERIVASRQRHRQALVVGVHIQGLNSLINARLITSPNLNLKKNKIIIN